MIEPEKEEDGEREIEHDSYITRVRKKMGREEIDKEREENMDLVIDKGKDK